MGWNELQLEAARTTLARHTAALERRLVDAYEHGDLGYINVLLSASSFTDFVERWDDIRYLVAQNETTVRERKAAEARVLAAEAALESERAQLTDSLQREQQTRYKLAALADQRRNSCCSPTSSAAASRTRSRSSKISRPLKRLRSRR